MRGVGASAYLRCDDCPFGTGAIMRMTVFLLQCLEMFLQRTHDHKQCSLELELQVLVLQLRQRKSLGLRGLYFLGSMPFMKTFV